MSRQNSSSPSTAAASSPPTAPPLPPRSHKPDDKHGGRSIKLKVRNDHDHFLHHPSTTSCLPQPPPTGPYFFYGTLMDARMLMEVLGRGAREHGYQHQPATRRACVAGYSRMLWGQYPALVEGVDIARDGGGGGGDGDGVIEGVVYYVPTVEEAEKLAAYETANYVVQGCVVRYMDGEEPRSEEGSVFVFAGDKRELREGSFDLGEWLRRMGR